MLKVDRISVMNMENAIRGARNPLNSWARSDSYYDEGGNYILGENDLALAKKLAKAGSDHRKYLRQIFANSTSTMHKIHSKEFERADFSCDRMTEGALAVLDNVIAYLENARLKYIETKDKSYWHDMIQLLPSSYNQMRTCTFNYETLINIYYARRTHKLAEWHTMCDWIMSLPYAKDIIAVKEEV